MLIRCWGSRGSLPVSGPEFERFGGDTTCLEIVTGDGQTIVVDAGTGIRRLGNRFLEQERYEYNFLFTHAHWDHLMGFPFFKPLYKRRARLLMQGCPFARQYVEKLISRVMAPPNFPIKPTEIRARIQYEQVCPTKFEIGSVTVYPIPLTHPNRGSGYKFVEDGKSFVFLTDNELDHPHSGGLSFEVYRDFVAGCDLMFHDAEFTAFEYARTKGWGHSLYSRVVELAMAAEVRTLGLFHHNQDRPDQGVLAIEEDSRRMVAEKGASVECIAVGRDMEFKL